MAKSNDELGEIYKNTKYSTDIQGSFNTIARFIFQRQITNSIEKVWKNRIRSLILCQYSAFV